MTDQLNAITSLVQKFNLSNEKFEIELHLNKKEEKRKLTLPQIMEMVCDKMKITPEYLTMKTREQSIVLPRQMCHYMGAKHSGRSLATIGFYFGGKNHATVLNSVRKINDRLDTDRQFRADYEYFLKQSDPCVLKHVG